MAVLLADLALGDAVKRGGSGDGRASSAPISYLSAPSASTQNTRASSPDNHKEERPTRGASSVAVEPLTLSKDGRIKVELALQFIKNLAGSAAQEGTSLPPARHDVIYLGIIVRAFQDIQELRRGVWTRLKEATGVSDPTLKKYIGALFPGDPQQQADEKLKLLKDYISAKPVSGALDALREAANKLLQQKEPAVGRSGPVQGSGTSTTRKPEEGTEAKRQGQADLACRARSGNLDAIKELVDSVRPWIRRGAETREGRGVPIEDLESAGVQGALKAIEKFEPNKPESGNFLTYAKWWIKQYMDRAIDNTSRTVRIPVHVLEDWRKISHGKENFFNLHARNPTDEEIATECKMSVERVQNVMKLGQQHIEYLDAPASNDVDAGTCHELFPSDELAPDQIVAMNEMRDTVTRLLTPGNTEVGLTHFQKKILKARFFNEAGVDPKDISFAKTASMFGCSDEHIRQQQNSALTQLRKFFKRRF